MSNKVLPAVDSLAVQNQNSEIISFSNLLNVQGVDALTDAALFNFMRDGLRMTVQVLSPFCASFLKRFQTAKQARKDFHGYTDFNRAAEELTGYSGRQVRNLAAGTPTPAKKEIAAATPPTPAAQPPATYEPDEAEPQDDSAIFTLADLPELDEAVKTPIQHPAINKFQSVKPAGTLSDLKQMQQEWAAITNPSIGRISIIASNVSSNVETAAGRFDLTLSGVTPAMMKKLREFVSCN